MGVRWPSQRSDGTLAVAARYVASRPQGSMALQKYVDEWPETHPEAHTLAVEELRALPHVVKREGEQIDVIFEAKAGSRLWKDVMVALVHDVPTEAGVEFEGFCDLVGGGFRPAWPGQA